MKDPVAITPAILEEIDVEYREHTFHDVEELRMAGRNTIAIKSDSGGSFTELPMTSEAQAFLHKWCQVPVQFLNLIEDDVLALANWNYFLNRYNQKGDARAIKAVVRNGMIKGWTRRSWQMVPPSEIVLACATALPGAMFEDTPHSSNGTVTFALTHPNLRHSFEEEAGFNRGLHHFSIFSQYDSCGLTIPEIRVHGHRHVCGNRIDAYCGVSGAQFRIFERDHAGVLQKFGEFTEKANRFIHDVFIPKINETLQHRCSDFANDLNSFLRRNRAPGVVQEIVFEAANVENLGGTIYHLSNALTRAANNDRCPREWVSRLQQMAANVTISTEDHIKHLCDSCHQPVPEQAQPNVH